MFDHIGIEVRSLAKSKSFYDQALAPLGIRVVMDLSQYGAYGYGRERPQFWIGGDGKPTSGEDEIHICFAAQDRQQVRKAYEAAIQAGGKDNGKPGLRPEYHEHYYGAFVFDFEGHNIEFCCHQPE